GRGQRLSIVTLGRVGLIVRLGSLKRNENSVAGFGFEKAQFLRRTVAAQRCVALRVATKALDDGAVFARITLLTATALDQQLVIVQSLAVHQRQVEKIKRRAAQLLIEALADSLFGERTRQVVGGKSAPVAAKHVARKLIENNDQGQQR